MTETPFFPQDVMQITGIRSVDTLRKHIKAGKVPPPDVGWHKLVLVRVAEATLQKCLQLCRQTIARGEAWFYNEIGWRMRRLMRRSVRPQNTRNAGKPEISTGRHLWHGTAP